MVFKRGNYAYSAILGALFLVFLQISCAPKKEDDVSKECVVNADQASLFKGHWTARPVPLAVEVNEFSGAELAAIEAAIEAWNIFFSQSKGFELYLSSGSNYAIVPAGGTRLNYSTACSQNAISGSGFVAKIMIFKNTSLPAPTYSSTMGLTSLCPVVVAGAQFRAFRSAVIELNYRDFWAAGKPIPDLQSVVTHELGHLLGLDHSCNGAGGTNAPSAYKTALMYPTIGFNGINGVIRRSIEKNDQERANCLY